MRWNKREQVQRPEYPQLVAIPGSAEEVADLLPIIRQEDSLTEVVDGGSHGVYLRVNNEAAAISARQYGERRRFSLQPTPKRGA